jgi:hypothetical protein
MSAAALLGVVCAQAEDVLPPLFAYDRYAKMVDNSPFAIATAVAAPAARILRKTFTWPTPPIRRMVIW